MTDLADLVHHTADRLTAQKHVGVVVAAVAGDRVEIRGAGRLGGGSKACPEADTLFEIGSVTKTFTSLALARMAVAGSTALDEPLADVLPPWSRVPTRDGQYISLEHLATHTSGLPRLPKGMLLPALLRPNAPDPYAACTAEKLLKGLAETKLGSVPGQRFRYSNLGGGLLGLALAERSGLEYAELIGREILEPLGMADTVVDVDAERAGRWAAGHGKNRKPVAPWNLADLVGAGGLRSTARDMAVFVQAQLDPGSGELADAMRLARDVEFRNSAFQRTHMGWISTGRHGKDYRQYWHNGGTGGFRSFVGCTPDAGVGVVLLSNTARSLDRPGLGLLAALEDRQAVAA
ncbi:serine hydrolase domain-containing protein [Yinghuangia soli]|uniref:Beta-lactamase family protein n=1 Tax=Yinghuangia soli TaxID=2908204 RepID=A0AA41Q2U5_9ACTN|nr:serine hydrolase domain-containing protein [Yinghuangia soli]MCF2530291.1 beta-lactamase family protein [Yinghuangia soli]